MAAPFAPMVPAATPPSEAEVKALLAQAQKLLPSECFKTAQRLAAAVAELARQLHEERTLLARLRRLSGLATSEKADKVLPDKKDEPSPKAPAKDAPPEPRPDKAKGHGRIPSAAYPGAQRFEIKHAHLAKGMGCPKCGKGHLYGLDPVELLRVFGQAPLFAKLWLLEHLRCSACETVYTAQAPAEAQGPKFDETAVAMMALLRYGQGQPLNRLEHLQGWLEVPVPASTQWQVVNEAAALLKPVYDEILRRAAQSPLLHDDDTYVRILQFMGKRREELLAHGELDDPERTGLFTTGVVAKTRDERTIVLFFSGRKHAGENLEALLKRRAAGLPAPMLMSDALDRKPEGHAVVEGNCLCHGRRNLVDQISNFPEECRGLIEDLREVFKIEARCVQEELSPEERLRVHQAESGPFMEKVKAKATELLEQKQVEPNSDMGRALNYFLNHWEALTLFLRVPGAPLDNNVCERILKMAIRHRNNSLFYKTLRGAEVGDLFMTLIATSVQNGVNPFEYLTNLLRHSTEVAARPADWLPWNFRTALQKAAEPATPAEPTPRPAAVPVTPPTIAPGPSRHTTAEPDAAQAPTPKELWEAALRAFADESPHDDVPGCGDRRARRASSTRRYQPQG